MTIPPKSPLPVSTPFATWPCPFSHEESLFPYSFNPGCSCDLLWPVECSRSVWWASSKTRPQEAQYVFTQSLGNLTLSWDQAWFTYWRVRNHVETQCTPGDRQPRTQSHHLPALSLLKMHEGAGPRPESTASWAQPKLSTCRIRNQIMVVVLSYCSGEM